MTGKHFFIMKTCCLSKLAILLISFQCKYLANTRCASRKIYKFSKTSPPSDGLPEIERVDLDHPCYSLEKSSKEQKERACDRESQNHLAILSRERKKKKSEWRHAGWVAEFNRSRPFNHTCSSLKHRRPIDEGVRQNWRIFNKPSLTMQRFCTSSCS